MRKNAKVTSIGFGHKIVVCQGGSKECPLQIGNVLSELYNIFKAEDDEINAIIPEGVLTVKIGETSKFCSDKILSSLLKIGMPLELSVSTLDTVLSEVLDIVKENKSLSTKEIRRVVSDAIRRVESVDKIDAEEWSYRYTRKYGHDNRQVVIYNYPDVGEQTVSYAVISKMIKEALKTIIPEDAVNAISRAQMDHMAEHIVEFVNGCDLYYIDYDMLINMIIELSRQPPHPWLITDTTRELIKEYDIQAIQSNIDKIIGNVPIKEGEGYCYAEIIHHASSLILQKYQWFLGAHDFSAFYILRSMLNKYSIADPSDILAINNSMERLERDLALAGYSLSEFQELLCDIDTMIRAHNCPSDNNRELTLKFGRLAIDIIRDVSLNKLLAFIDSNWSEQEHDDVFRVVTQILNTLMHASSCECVKIHSDTMCRFVYSSMTVNDYTLKKHYVVVYCDRDFDVDTLASLNTRKVSEYTDVVILVSQDGAIAPDFVHKASEITKDMYWFVPMSKDDMRCIVTSDSPSSYFYSMLRASIK